VISGAKLGADVYAMLATDSTPTLTPNSGRTAAATE
jgi:hypothetical protein